MFIRPWLEALKTRWIPKNRRVAKRLNQKPLPSQIETLEEKLVLSAFDLITVIPNQGVFLSDGAMMSEAPREMTLRFSPGQNIDPATLGNAAALGGITVVRAGLDGIFDNPATPAVESTDDVPVTVGYIGVGENANNEVVIRFAATLPDDKYEIRINGSGATALKTTAGTAFNDGVNKTFHFELDLGAQVEAVVPQPVLRSQVFTVADSSLLVNGDTITVTTGPYTTILEFNTAPGNVAPGHVYVNRVGNNATVATAIANAISSLPLPSSVTSTAAASGGTVTITGSAYESTLTFATANNRALSKSVVNVLSATNLKDGDTMVVSLGATTLTLEFNNTAVNNLISPNRIRVDYTTVDSAATLAAAIATALNKPANNPTQTILATLLGSDLAFTGTTGTPSVSWTNAVVSAGVFNQNFGSLTQASNKVVVYFNQDQLDPVIAQNPTFYKVVDAVTGAVLLPAKVDYAYNPANGLSAAVLTFGVALPNSTYNIKIGKSNEPSSSIATAVRVGSIFANQDYVINEYLGDGGTSAVSNDASDEDFYQFTISATGSITLTLNPSATLDGYIELFNSSGTLIGAPTDAIGLGVVDTYTSTPLSAGTYYVRVTSHGGTGGYKLTIHTDLIAGTSDQNSSFSTATDLGQIGAGSVLVSGQIQPQLVLMPPLPGGPDEPGHRDLPDGAFVAYSSPEVGHGIGAGSTPTAPGAIPVVTYSFPDVYGQDQFGNDLHNQTTPEQKQMARQIFEIYSQYTGIQFRELSTTVSGASNIGIVTGDIRVNAPTLGPTQVGGISGNPLIINGAIYANDNTFGGGWMSVAFHEIGHDLGLGHSYDIPSTQGGSTTEGPLEQYFTGENDFVHLLRILRNDASDIDLYKFTLTQAGTLTAQTIAERLSSTSDLNTLLTLYQQNPDGTKTVIARNDDFYSNDSGLSLALSAGTYFIGVTSSGNNNYDPSISDSGNGGTSDGAYQLKLDFQAAPSVTSTLRDATGRALDGDHDGKAGGEYNGWFTVANTKIVDKLAQPGGNGSLANPYSTISAALAAAGTGDIVRIVGNGGADRDDSTIDDNVPYAIGTDYNLAQTPLADGATLQVPKGVTVMIDAGALVKVHATTIDVGTSSLGNDRSHGALQVLGTPLNNVYFTSWRDDAKGSIDDGVNGSAAGSDWGGIVFRKDSDSLATGVFLNLVNHATLQYGGGQVSVDGALARVYNVIDIETSRPTITNNIIQNNSDAAISANPNSFKADDGRIGPDIHGNLVTQNSTNGLFIRIQTALGGPAETLDVIAEFDDTDITHVITQNLIINGQAGGSLDGVARFSGRLLIAPGTVVKLSGARIETGLGNSNLIAEGTAADPIRFTSQQDDKYGAGGTFDLKNDGFASGAQPVAGNWAGFYLQPTSTASFDHVSITYAGGTSEVSGGQTDNFNTIEAVQATLRISNSVLENNAGGMATNLGNNNNRDGRGWNDNSVIFVRGAQPIIVANIFRNNAGSVVSINANSLKAGFVPDYGRSTGMAQAYTNYDNNQGPFVRLNTYDKNALNGMLVRAEELVVEGVWDDTDIAHIVTGEIVSSEFHTYGGLRLESSSAGSLVVKLLGANAGFTATGDPLEISDRIGGTVQIIGQPGFPVILTSLKDDTVSAGFKPNGLPQYDTNNDVSVGNPGDWRSISLKTYSNDTNMAVINEREVGVNNGNDINGTNGAAQSLGNLAPNLNNGDENRRLGFEVHGYISSNSPGDVDVYSFTGTAGTEVWIDIDRTSDRLDSMIELVDSLGNVLARSLNSQNEAADPAAWLSTYAGSLAGTAGNSLLNTLTKDPTLGGDFYTSNFHDAGFRVILPGTSGTTNNFFIRVRSQPVAGQETNPAYVNKGLTSGGYQLQVRLQQRDQKPGSTVRYADVRFATNGIETHGLPAHSVLTGEAGETTSPNDSTSTAQYLGPLLQSDRGTLSVSGNLASATDVDWYKFTVDYSQIQVAQPGAKFFPTIFDIDWADGLTRPDTIMAVFNGLGDLIYIGRESDIANDQPGAGQGQDLDDLTRATLGKLDPFIGTVNLPAGVNGVSEGGGALPTPPSSALTTYYVAIASNGMTPSALTAYFDGSASATTQQVRLEPVNSIQRIVEDHIGFTGYESQGTVVAPVSGPMIDIRTAVSLSANIRAFTLSDVNLFVTKTDSLYVYDPFNGSREIDYTDYVNKRFSDIDMLSDGRLIGLRTNLANGQGTEGFMVQLDTGTGQELGSATGDGIAVPAANANPILQQSNNSNNVNAFVIHQRDVGDYDYSYLSVDAADNSSQSGISKLYRATTAGGAGFTRDGFGAVGQIKDAGGLIQTQTTGMQFSTSNGVSGALYGVSAGGQFYRIDEGRSPDTDNGNGITTNLVTGTVYDLTTLTGGAGFAGLTDAPQNVENRRYANLLFALTTDGKMIAIDPANPMTPQIIFDTNSDNAADSNRLTLVNASGATGLAFSPVDYNLWHPTTTRGGESGHGVTNTTGTSAVPSVDNSRTPGAEDQDVVGGSWALIADQAYGGASMYFGVEQYTDELTYYSYGNQGQYGVLDPQAKSQQNLTATTNNIRGNYNVPGGTSGSLVTNSFSLQGYDATDKPTLYFNYWLQSDNDSGKDHDSMTDAARVYVSRDSGKTWELVATNNSTLSAAEVADAELPAYASTSRNASAKANQQVQELFDSSSWRQARVDLNDYAGESNLLLRFDFSTSGQSGHYLDQRVGSPTFGKYLVTDDQSVEGFIPDTGSAFGINNGTIYSPQTAQRNTAEGFYIDDILVGFAGRGEMVTGAAGAGSLFTDLMSNPFAQSNPLAQRTKDPNPLATPQLLSGNYQLEIRQGEQYGQLVSGTKPDIAVTPTRSINDPLVDGATIRVGNNIQDGNTITIYDGLITKTFEFDTNGSVASGNVPVTVQTAGVDARAGAWSTALADAIYQAFGPNSRIRISSPSAKFSSGQFVELVPNINSDQIDIVGAEIKSVFGTNPTVTDLGTATDSGFGNDYPVNGIASSLPPMSSGTNGYYRVSGEIGNGPHPDADSDFYQINLLFGEKLDVALTVTGGTGTHYTLVLMRSNGIVMAARDGVLQYVADAASSYYLGVLGDDGEVSTLPYDPLFTFSLTNPPPLASTGNDKFNYQLNISLERAGTSLPRPLSAESYVRRGDSNLPRTQGQIIIENNSIISPLISGIVVDDSERDAAGNSHPGAPRNTPVTKNGWLTGMYLQNNVIAHAGVAGIDINGDPNLITSGISVSGPAAVPFVKVVNNTIYGGTNQGTGIRVSQNASPTLMNNVLVGLATGISVDPSSSSTVVEANLYQNNSAGNGPLGNNSIVVPNGVQLFVDAAQDNFYPAPNSPLIDSSRSTFDDRANYVAVVGPLGISQSPIIAPNFDKFGQLRVDDVNQPGPSGQPGLGQNPFQDRGAIERADFEGGVVIPSLPQDNDGGGIDLDPSVTTIWIDAATVAAPFSILTNFTLRLTDAGIGINDSTVDGTDFLLTQDGVPLIQGQDYTFTYNQNTNEVIFTSVSTFKLDARYQIVVDSAAIVDMAGNPLQNNQAAPFSTINPNVSSRFSSSQVYFTYIVTDGANSAPVNTAPTAVSVNEDSSFTFTGTDTISVNDIDAFLASDGDPTMGSDGGRIQVSLSLPDATLALPGGYGTLTLGDTTNLVLNGGSVSGTGTVSDPLILNGRIVDLREALLGLTYAPPHDYPGTVQPAVPLTIKTEDFGKFGPAATNLATTSTINITVNPVNDVPVFTKGLDQTVDEDTGAHSILTWAMGVSSGPTNESGQALTFLITGNSNSSLFSSGPTVAADGTLSYTLAPNASGFADITIKLKDDGGVANGGIDTSAAQTFRITVNPINDAPTLNQPADSTALEDVPQTVPLSGISAGPLEGSQNLVITAVSSDPLIVPNPTIAYNQGSANAILTYQSVANQSGGPITITVTVTDNGGTANGGINVVTKTFLVNVTAVNDAPTLTVPGPATVYRDDIPSPAPFVVNLTDIGTGPLEGSQSISSILVTSSDQSIVPNANITQGSVVGGALQLTIQPLSGQFGTITFTVTVVDSGPNGGPNNDINFVTKTFTVNLLALNHEPSFTVNPPTTTLTVLEDAGQQTINLNNISAGPPREIGQTLILSAVSQNTSLINNVIVSSIVNGVATVKYTPVANAFGQTTIRITLQDSGGTNAGGDDTYFQDITINVTPVNDVPTLNIIPNQPTSGVLLEGAGEQTINLSGITTGPTNENGQTLTLTAAITSGNANLVNNFVFSAVNGNGQATLKYTPVGDEFGTATVTVTVTDGGINGGPNGDVNVTTRTFTITVLPVNDRPTLDNISDRASDEDAGQQSIGLTGISVGPTNEAASQTLSFTIVSDNPGLIPNDAGHLSVLFTQGSTTGTILYTSTANASGIANITVTMKDSGGAANGGFDTIVKTFKITILPVPDAPTNITLVGDTLLENLPGNTLVGTLSTTDADLPSDSFTYSVVGGTGLGLFQISGSQLRTSQGLNYEGTVPPGTYTVVIRSTDSSTLFFEKEFTIHVIDVNEPATAISVAVNPISNLPNSIPENQPVNSVVGTLVAVDPDSGDHSTFTLVTGAGADDNALFKIVNGQLVANTVFNYEVKNSYTVRVRATDSQGVTFETPITITITNVNEAPTNINLSNSTVVENTAAGTVVGAFDAVDPDANETFTYALVSGPGSTNNAKFTINANGELVIQTPPNYEDPGHFYTIRVRVTDGGLQSFEKTFTITILNVNEAPTALTLSALNINENMAVGSTVGTFATADQDVPETFEYSLVTGSGSDDNAAFTISGNKLLTAEKFDFESRTSYSVRVRTRDSAGNQLEQVFVITINDTKDGPVVTLSSSSGTTKGRKAVTVDVGAQITDIDSTNFDGGKLVVAIHSGEQAGDTISIKSSTVDGLKLKLVKGKTVLRLGTRDIATVSGGVRGIPLTVRFGTGISPDLMQSVLRNITFKGKPFAAERVISVQAFDETGLPSNVANRSIVVT